MLLWSAIGWHCWIMTCCQSFTEMRFVTRSLDDWLQLIVVCSCNGSKKTEESKLVHFELLKTMLSLREVMYSTLYLSNQARCCLLSPTFRFIINRLRQMAFCSQVKHRTPELSIKDLHSDTLRHFCYIMISVSLKLKEGFFTQKFLYRISVFRFLSDGWCGVWCLTSQQILCWCLCFLKL